MFKQKISLAILMAFVISFAAHAQTGTSSPYSLSGLGEVKFTGFAEQRLMGGASKAYRNNNNYTILNPASYTAMKSTVYNVGLNFNVGELSTDTETTTVSNGNFGYFSMGFSSPYNEKFNWGLAMGIHQLTDVGYDLKIHNTDTFNSYNLFKGKGGLSTAYLGAAISPYKGLSLGANVNYNFGNITAVRAQVYPNDIGHFSFSDETYMYYRGFNFDFGVQYSIQSGEVEHVFGATFNTAANLKGKGYRYAETFLGRKFDQEGIPVSIDTLLYNDSLERKAIKPQQFGFAYSISKGEQWAVTVEYEKSAWSTILSELNNKSYFDNERFSFGASWVPNPNYTVQGGFFAKTRYSVGFRYEKLYYNFFDQQINEIGIGFGLGLPIIKSYQSKGGKVPLVNRVNLGAEFIRRGTTEHNLIQEDFINFTIGLNFNDKWFLKRKYQ